MNCTIGDYSFSNESLASSDNCYGRGNCTTQFGAPWCLCNAGYEGITNCELTSYQYLKGADVVLYSVFLLWYLILVVLFALELIGTCIQERAKKPVALTVKILALCWAISWSLQLVFGIVYSTSGAEVSPQQSLVGLFTNIGVMFAIGTLLTCALFWIFLATKMKNLGTDKSVYPVARKVLIVLGVIFAIMCLFTIIVGQIGVAGAIPQIIQYIIAIPVGLGIAIWSICAAVPIYKEMRLAEAKSPKLLFRNKMLMIISSLWIVYIVSVLVGAVILAVIPRATSVSVLCYFIFLKIIECVIVTCVFLFCKKYLELTKCSLNITTGSSEKSTTKENTTISTTTKSGSKKSHHLES